MIGWKVLQNDSDCDHFEVESRKKCGDTHPINTWISNERSITFNHSQTVTDNLTVPVVFNITNRNIDGGICQKLQSNIQINESCKQKLINQFEPIINIIIFIL